MIAKSPDIRLYTPEEAATYLSISERKLRQLLSAGKIPSRKLGRHRRICVEDLDRFIDALPKGKFDRKVQS